MSASKKPKRAVALRYEPNEGTAPRVTAQGTGHVADRILTLARENGVPIREDRNLVEVLARLDLDEEIPPTVYQAVAEVLAFVYRASRPLRSE